MRFIKNKFKIILFSFISTGLIRLFYTYYSKNIGNLPKLEGFHFLLIFVVLFLLSSFTKRFIDTFLRILLFLLILPFTQEMVNQFFEITQLSIPQFFKGRLYFLSYGFAGTMSFLLYGLFKRFMLKIFYYLVIFPFVLVGRFFRKITKLIRRSIKGIPQRDFMHEIDNIQAESEYERGRIFEEIIAEIYNRIGYHAETTGQMRAEGRLPESIQKRGGSGEQGVDVMVTIPARLSPTKKAVRMAVQAKLYSNKVSNSAVQEIAAALPLYRADLGVVITNNFFTAPAMELAQFNNIELFDRDRLETLIENSYKKKK